MFSKKIVSICLKARRDERGVVTIIIALLLVILFGFMGLAVDVGSAFLVRTQMQAAADAAALAGATDRKYHGNSVADIASAITVAKSISAQNGFVDNQDSLTVDVRIPPLSSPSALPGTPPPIYSDNNKYVRVIITKTNVPLYFAPLIGVAKTWTITVNAVAGFKNSADCFIAYSSYTNTGKASVEGNCSIDFGSGGFKGQGSGRINLTGGGDFNAYEGGTLACSICFKNGTQTNSANIQAGEMPTAPTVPFPTGLTTKAGCSGGICQPGIYNSRLDVKNGAYIFNAGSYVLNAGIDMNNKTSITGSGVLLYFNNAGRTESFDGNMRLTAPASTNCDAGSGVVIYSPNESIVVKGTAILNFDGIIALPTTEFRSNGGSQFTLAGSLLADTLKLDGNTTSTVSENVCNNFVSPSRISLVE